MGNVEHYFENLLHNGLDYADETNTKYLSPEVIDAVQTCAAYVAFTMFCGEKDLYDFFHYTPDEWEEWEEIKWEANEKK